MLGWWIVDAVLFLVVIPALVVVLTLVLRAALAVKREADRVAAHGPPAPSGADALDGLERTPQLLSSVTVELEHYAAALDALRPGAAR